MSRTGHLEFNLTGHPGRRRKDTPFSRYLVLAKGKERARNEDRKGRVGPMRCVFRSVPSSLSFVASSCPFVIYVCFMARRIRKRLIKDSRVAARESDQSRDDGGRVNTDNPGEGEKEGER